MSESTTRPAEVDSRAFVAAVEHDTGRADAETLLDLMRRVTGWAGSCAVAACPPGRGWN